jgi:hypothetical protein
MNKYGIRYIINRQRSGSRAKQTGHISVTGMKKITIGCCPKSNIAFDLSPGDIVSRRRAVIRVVGDDQIPFRP